MLCLKVSSAYRSAIFVSAFPIAGLRSRDRFPGLTVKIARRRGVPVAKLCAWDGSRMVASFQPPGLRWRNIACFRERWFLRGWPEYQCTNSVSASSRSAKAEKAAIAFSVCARSARSTPGAIAGDAAGAAMSAIRGWPAVWRLDGRAGRPDRETRHRHCACGAAGPSPRLLRAAIGRPASGRRVPPRPPARGSASYGRA